MHKYSFLFCLLALLSLSRGTASDTEWWNDSWKYRMMVEIVPSSRRGAINTARMNLKEQSEFCASDGRDVRVLDKNQNLLPSRVEAESDTLSVIFKVSPDAQTYYVYYGNKEAKSKKQQWKEKLGGLTLQTFVLPQTTYNARQIPSLLNQNPKKFGEADWPQINDLENPFGQNDEYLSLYTGTIFCPEKGKYTFALNADDMALLRLKTGDQRTLRAWRDAAVPSETWKDPKHKGAYFTTEDELESGVYRFWYYHGENGGAQLAKLGWQTPTSDAIVTVPPRAFVRYLPVKIMGRQKRNQKINPFFVAQHRYTLVVNDGAAYFPRYEFESRSPEHDSAASSYKWSFGDDTYGTGQSAYHDFPGVKPYTTTLTMEMPDGEKASVGRTIRPSREPQKRMTLRMDAQFENDIPILRAGREAHLKIFVKNISSLPHKVVFHNMLADNRQDKNAKVVDAHTIQELAPSVSGPDGWQELNTSFALPPRNVYSSLRLLMHKQPIIEKKLAVLSTDSSLGKLRIDRSGNLRDKDDRLVLLRLSHVKLQDAAQRQIQHDNDGIVRLLFFDDRLAGPASGGNQDDYISILTQMLDERFPSIQFSAIRPDLRVQKETSILRRFLAIRRKILSTKANIVILVGQPETVLNNVPRDDFRSYLFANLDQILSQTSATALLVTPPPLPGRPQLSSKYANITKRVALKTGIPVADVYTRLMLTPQWRQLFRPSEKHPSSYNIHLNSRGQNAVARELYNSILDRMGDELDRLSN